MRKLCFLFSGALLSFAFIFNGTGTTCERALAESNKIVYVGGMSAGFTLKSGSAQVVGLCEVVTENGISSPALNAGLRTGDRIVKIEGITVETIADLNEIVNKSKGKALTMQIERGKQTLDVCVQPVKEKIGNKYKIGILARDSVSGIGTVTYIDKQNNRFASLGHSVVVENKRELKISDGIVYACNIVGVSKGIRGRAGELRGMFISDKQFGKAEKLCDCGIFGTISEDFSWKSLTQVEASSTTAIPGNAYIYSTINGMDVEKYEIEIVKVDRVNKENKNYVIKITDDRLIAETGGIVQGMSGSPILQNGKLIGAVTHVFLNDPTRGYGIDIQTMLKE